jgi:hypothetical protein
MANVVVLQRNVKRGNVRTFDEEYNRGYTDIWASEVDADFDTLFDAWNSANINAGETTISPLPPQSPVPGDLWWRTTDGNLFVYYDDGNSAQFVPAVSTGQYLGTGLPTGDVPPGEGDLAGTYPAPTIALNAVTTNKIADGAVTDAKIVSVAWSKITGAPTTMPPSGPAGGILQGTYPNPSGVLWSGVVGAPAAFPPSGPAGGALTGTYPNPGVDYNHLTNKPTIPTVPSSLPPSGPAGGSLAGTYPSPTFAIGSTVKVFSVTALSSARSLSTTEQFMMQAQWNASGGRWVGLAAMHGHFGLAVSGPSTGAVGQLRLGGNPSVVDGSVVSSQLMGSTAIDSGVAIVPFSIFLPVQGNAVTPGQQTLKMTAWIQGQVVGAAGLDSAWIMVYEPA